MFDAQGYCRDADGFLMNPLGAFERRGNRSLRLFKKGEQPAADPRIGEAAQRQMDLAEQQYADFKTNYAPAIQNNLDTATRVADEQNTRAAALQDYTLGRAKIYDDRWDNTQVPLEDQIIAAAKSYNEPGEQERMASQAGEDVAQAFRNSQGQTTRALQARGISLNSGAAISALSDTNTQRAMAEAAAVNKTRDAAKQIGWTRLGEAAALGRGLPSFGTASASLSNNAGNSALTAGTAGVGLAAGASGASNAGYSTGAGMFGQAGQTLNTMYSNQIAGYKASADNDPLNSVLGAATGVGMKMLMAAPAASDRRLKTNIVRIGQLSNGLPVYSYDYKWGGPKQIGVMADEVAVVAPHAHAKGVFNGYDGVYYSKL